MNDIKNPPPKGTPLRHITSGKIYYSTGTTNNLDRLYCDSSPNASEQEFMFPLDSLQYISIQVLQNLSSTDGNFQDKIIDFLKENLKIRIESDSHGGPRTEHEIQLLINDQVICSTYLP